MSSGRDQAARLLALVPYLLGRDEVRLDEAAAHFGVTPAQLDADLRLLFMVGLPGGYPDDLIDVDLDALEGEGVIRVGNADYLGRPVRFAPAEATALVVALRTMLETSSDAAERELVERTLGKLEAVLAEGEGPTMHVRPDTSERLPHLPVLQSALARGHQLRITYYTPAREETTERVVDPRGLARVDGLVYLDAWCHQAGGERVFRVDRISAATELTTPVADASARPRDLTRDWFADDATTPVRLRLDPRAAWVTEYYATREVAVHEDHVDLTLEAASLEWVLRLLGRLAPYAQVLSPEEVRTAHAERMRAALALHAAG